MKAISLHQPWASLMALNLKKNETRGWSTNYRGPLLIHATARKPKKEDIEYLQDKCFDFGAYFYSHDLTLGAIICEVNLIDCQQIGHENCPSQGVLEYYLGNYDHGRFMWITENVKKLKPIPYKGHQRFFNVPDELLECKKERIDLKEWQKALNEADPPELTEEEKREFKRMRLAERRISPTENIR